MLSFKRSGEVGGPLVVLLHAANFDGRSWRAILPSLAEFEVLTIDLPGHGESVDIPFEGFEAAADEVADVIRSEADKPAALAAISMGAYVALRLLERHPGVIDTAVLSGIQAQPISLGFLPRATMRAAAQLTRFRCVRERLAAAVGITDLKLASDPTGAPVASVETTMQVAEAALDFKLGSDVNQICARCLILAGEKEHSAILEAIPEFKNQLQYCSAYLVRGLGHGWIAKDPDLFARTLTAWIRGKELPNELLCK